MGHSTVPVIDAADLRAVSAPCALGESPFWHPDEQVLYWCDIPGRSLHRLDPRSGASAAWDFESEPASCAPIQGGGLLLAMRDGLWRFDPAQGRRTLLAQPPYDPRVERFNDGKCDPQGRFWVGTIWEPRDRPAASLYCWDGQRLARRAGDVMVSNGLAWSPDGATMYWTDTRAHTIQALDFDGRTGGLSRRRPFASFSNQPEARWGGVYGGRPDGAAVDAQGCYWCALFEGAQILKLDPQGCVVGRMLLPVQCPTMVCFGGPDLRTLYITTARAHRPDAELARQPLAGCVLAVTVDATGLPVHFASR